MRWTHRLLVTHAMFHQAKSDMRETLADHLRRPVSMRQPQISSFFYAAGYLVWTSYFKGRVGFDLMVAYDCVHYGNELADDGSLDCE